MIKWRRAKSQLRQTKTKMMAPMIGCQPSRKCSKLASFSSPSRPRQVRSNHNRSQRIIQQTTLLTTHHLTFRTVMKETRTIILEVMRRAVILADCQVFMPKRTQQARGRTFPITTGWTMTATLMVKSSASRALLLKRVLSRPARTDCHEPTTRRPQVSVKRTNMFRKALRTRSERPSVD